MELSPDTAGEDLLAHGTPRVSPAPPSSGDGVEVGESELCRTPAAGHQLLGEHGDGVLVQNNDFHFRVESLLSDGRRCIRLTRRHAAQEEILAEQPLEGDRVYLKVAAVGQAYSFWFGTSPDNWGVLKEDVDGRTLSRTTAGGFVGTYIAMYASGNGTPSSNVADFDWFEYTGESQK
jgi:DNA-binding transcriptional LysR family regulator